MSIRYTFVMTLACISLVSFTACSGNNVGALQETQATDAEAQTETNKKISETTKSEELEKTSAEESESEASKQAEKSANKSRKNQTSNTEAAQAETASHETEPQTAAIAPTEAGALEIPNVDGCVGDGLTY